MQKLVFFIFLLCDCLSFNPISSLLKMTDTDECASAERNECDANAQCTNTEGSYICRCLSGFQGDGTNCTGKYLFHTSSEI